MEGDNLKISPRAAALPMMQQLKARKLEIIAILRGVSVEYLKWREPFTQWIESSCIFHPLWFGGLTCLHRQFSEWMNTRDGDPCDRESFIRLLRESGYLMGRVEGTILVSGLALRDDVEAYADAPAPSRETSISTSLLSRREPSIGNPMPPSLARKIPIVASEEFCGGPR